MLVASYMLLELAAGKLVAVGCLSSSWGPGMQRALVTLWLSHHEHGGLTVKAVGILLDALVVLWVG